MRHFLLATLYSGCLAVFFGSLLRDDLRSALRFGLRLFGIMVGSVYVFGWLMALLGR
jgi:hypothetical protein